MADTASDDNRNVPPVNSDLVAAHPLRKEQCASANSESNKRKENPLEILAGKKQKSSVDDIEATATTVTPRSTENDNSRMNISHEESIQEEKISGVIIIEFVGRSKEENIINDKETVIELLRLSIFIAAYYRYLQLFHEFNWAHIQNLNLANLSQGILIKSVALGVVFSGGKD